MEIYGSTLAILKEPIQEVGFLQLELSSSCSQQYFFIPSPDMEKVKLILFWNASKNVMEAH